MWLTILMIVLVVLAILAGLSMTLVGLPGNWLIVLTALIQKMLASEDSRLAVSWYLLAAILCLGLFGEACEFAAGAWGVAKAGGSRRAISAALAGSLLGGFAGLWIPVPIPLVGPIIGAVLFASLGAFAGAYSGERTLGRSKGQSLPVGIAAFFGRIAGTVSKFGCGMVMAALLLLSLFW